MATIRDEQGNKYLSLAPGQAFEKVGRPDPDLPTYVLMPEYQQYINEVHSKRCL